MKDAVLSSRPQRTVALTDLAKSIFKEEARVNAALDAPRTEFNGKSAIQHAAQGIEQYREAAELLKAEL